MDMQGMPASEMHNTFWRENQVIVTFHSDIPLVSTDGINQGGLVLDQLDLELQRVQLNTFLAEHGLNYTLNFYEPVEYQEAQRQRPLETSRAFDLGARRKSKDSFTPPPGIYLFGLSEPVQSEFGVVATSITTFFDFTPGENMQRAMIGMMPEVEGSSRDDRDDNGEGQDGDNEGGKRKQSPVVPIVNVFNHGLSTLNNDRQVPISAASPNWLWGGTGFIPQGCPLTPPMPVDDACSFWHFHLPQLSPELLRTMTGEDVAVFVLDTLPEHHEIKHAVEEAGDDNLLLFDVSRNVTFNYDLWNAWRAGVGDPMIPPLAVAKDVYGRHYAIRMADHGLFIAGIVHDIAPHARVECVRMMSDYCVSDSDLFLSVLQYIQNRMLPGGDLYHRPVVINLSCVMPTIAEAQAEGIDPSGAVTNNVLTTVGQQIQALTQLGAIVVASAGNEGDLRENPSGSHPAALYPAAFADSPFSICGVIPVGAVDGSGNVTSYSCYPGAMGIATYGGEVPAVKPRDPPDSDPQVTVTDAIRGVYSAIYYPPLSKDWPALPYKAPNDHGWAYWVGTSFATPIISAVAARVLEMQFKSGGPLDCSVTDAIIGAAGSVQTQWDNLDASTNVPGGSAMGPMILAVQECQIVDKDHHKKKM